MIRSDVLPVLSTSPDEDVEKDVYHFVDGQVFNDQCTSSVITPRRIDFCARISGRDQRCVITGNAYDDCDAAHIIPGNKGSEVRSSDARARVLEAMDRVLCLSMWVKGATPQSMVAEREKQKRERERRTREHSSDRVRQWLDSDASVSAFIQCLFLG